MIHAYVPKASKDDCDYNNLKDCVVKIDPINAFPQTALDSQVAGSHYKTKGIQPVEYIHANGLGFCEGNVVKYVTRWRDKGGLEDLKKAVHYLELLMELEAKMH